MFWGPPGVNRARGLVTPRSGRPQKVLKPVNHPNRPFPGFGPFRVFGVFWGVPFWGPISRICPITIRIMGGTRHKGVPKVTQKGQRVFWGVPQIGHLGSHLHQIHVICREMTPNHVYLGSFHEESRVFGVFGTSGGWGRGRL